MKQEIPSDAQVLIDEFLAAEPKSNNSKPKDKARRQAESLRSGKPLTPLEAIALAIDHGAEISYGGKHCRIQMGDQEIGISLRPAQKTLPNGISNDLKKLLGLK